MLAILQLESELFEILYTITPNVFSHLPDDHEYPLIHIESIEPNIWLHKPMTLEVEMKICLYSLGYSNKGVLEFGEEVQQAIDTLNYPQRIEESLITQVKDDLWCNEIKLKIWTTHKGSEP